MAISAFGLHFPEVTAAVAGDRLPRTPQGVWASRNDPDGKGWGWPLSSPPLPRRWPAPQECGAVASISRAPDSVAHVANVWRKRCENSFCTPVRSPSRRSST